MWVYKIFYKEICQHLEDLCNSVNQYFPNDVRKSCKSKRQDRPMDVTGTEYNGSMIWFQIPRCNSPFRNFHLFSCRTKKEWSQSTEKATKILPFSPYIRILFFIQFNRNNNATYRMWTAWVVKGRNIQDVERAPEQVEWSTVRQAWFNPSSTT